MRMSNAYPDFPFRDPIGGGAFIAREHYLGAGLEQLYFGCSTTDENERCLVSVTVDNGLDPEAVGEDLARSSPGLLETAFIGSFDADGADSGRDRLRRQHCVLVERIPDGVPIGRAATDVSPYAVSLGLQIGRILAEACRNEILLVSLRPEYVWVRSESGLVVSGLGGRNTLFLTSARRNRDLPSVPLFNRRYLAPEVYKRQPFDDRAVVLTLAVMIAEWATGSYPYAIDDGAWGYNNLAAGEHLPLQVDASFSELLSRGMEPDPLGRPTLDAFLTELDQLRTALGQT
jgi:hypothetical protein